MSILKRLLKKKNKNFPVLPKNENKKSKTVEKILMGAVIGGAIGSVVGASIRSRNNDKPKRKYSILRKLLGIKKKIPIETEKKDL